MTDERDIRDPALDALLRAHLHETPPPAVDAAILTAAHRAVESTPRVRTARATQAWRWWMPLAAAAVIGVVVVGIMPVAPTLVEPAAPTISDVPVAGSLPGASRSKSSDASKVEHGGPPLTPQRSEPPNAPPPKSEAVAAPPAIPAPTRKTVEAAPASSSPTRKTTAAAPPAPQLGATRELGDRGAAVSRPAEANTAAAERSMVPSPAAAPAPAPSLSSAPAAATDASAAAVTSPPVGALSDQRAKQAARTSGADEWIAQIRTLRSDGRMTEAAGALKAFRAAFNDADTRLPEDLREWAKTVR
jgi:Meckel syndrome type 1 protein